MTRTDDTENGLIQKELPHSGMVAVVGRANTGKSTLVKALLEEKISIVSPVAQTTRNVIRGILNEPRGQIVFLDTPGIHHPMSELGKMMNKMSRSTVEGVDAVLLVLDASSAPEPEDEGWIRRLVHEECAVIAALNKVDLGDKSAGDYRQLWNQILSEKKKEKKIQWMSTSARAGTGREALLTTLFDCMPPGPELFPDDVLTDFPRKLIMADTIREKLFQVLTQELPHSIAVGIDVLHESDGGAWDIKGTVYVDKPTQKGIVVGKSGRLIRRVQREAAREISDIYDRPVHLKLWVKVEKNWQKNFFLLKRLGYR